MTSASAAEPVKVWEHLAIGTTEARVNINLILAQRNYSIESTAFVKDIRPILEYRTLLCFSLPFKQDFRFKCSLALHQAGVGLLDVSKMQRTLFSPQPWATLATPPKINLDVTHNLIN